jgi:hypothetical protein
MKARKATKAATKVKTGPARSQRADPKTNEGPARSQRADPKTNEGPPSAKTRARTRSPARASSAGADVRVAELLSSLRADKTFAPVVSDYDGRTAEAGRRTFGSNGLKVRGKLFALFTQGTLVVKLSKERVAALVGEGVGRPFDPGHGRLMKEWLTVTSAKASWVDLAREAHDFVRGTGSR